MTRPAYFALGYAALIVGLSSIPGPDLPEARLLIGDKLIHTLEYFGFAVILASAIPMQRRPLIAFGVAALFGGLDESYQLLIPGRVSSFTDWTADVLGASIGSGLFWWWDSRR